jgi:glycosidase
MRQSRSPRRFCGLWAATAALLGWGAAGAAAQPKLPPGFELRVTPISGGLGLADVEIVLPADAGSGVELRVAGGGRGIAARMRPEPIEGSVPPRVRYTCRVLAGRGSNMPVTMTLGFTVWSMEGAEGLSHGPFKFETAPPIENATPDWAKGAVWYQIFPERFRNGNEGNDLRGAAFFKKEWTSDWYGFDVDELEAARARVTMEPPHVLRAIADPRSPAMQARRYGGDLEGVVEKLDELRDLGVTAIYLNPVFQAHSHHKYDATDFRHIDPTFAGSGHDAAHAADSAAIRGETEDPATWVWTQADRYVLDTLLPEVHGRGMRIVFDGVWNHVGTRFWAFEDVRLRGRESKYAPWFQAEFVDEKRMADEAVRAMDVREGSLIAWKSWNGVNGSLPVFARGANGRLHPEVEQHVFEVTRRWMSPAEGKRGIDGWRLDVVPDLPRPFWEAWRSHAKSINPDGVLLGEMWFDAREYFSGGNDAKEKGGGAVFDGQMNYPVAMPLVRWLADETYTSEQLGVQLARVVERPAQHELVQMNLLGSHDTARVATMIEAGLSEYGGQIPLRVQRSRPSAETYEKLALGIAVLACWPGSPMVYYGDEYGMHGGNDPHCRKPLPWADAGEMANTADRAEPGLRDKFRAWLRLRQDDKIGEVLRYGDVRIIETGNADVFAFERGLNGQRVVCVANRGDAAFDAAPLLEVVRSGAKGPPRRIGSEEAIGQLRIVPRSTGVFEMVGN